MSVTGQHAPSPPENRSLWIGILGGPLLWITHQQVSYLLVRWACGSGHLVVLHVVSAVFLGVAGLLIASAAGNVKRMHKRADNLFETTPHRRSFMAGLGLALSALFAFAMVLQWIPNLLLDPCHR